MCTQRLNNIRNDVLVHIFAPDNVEVFISLEGNRNGMRRQLPRHLLDVHQRVGRAVQQHDGRDDVACGESRGSIRGHARHTVRRAREGKRLHVVVVHLELAVAHDLEPVHDRLDRRERVQVRVRRVLLRRGDVVAAPVEQPAQRVVDHCGEHGWVEDRLPAVCGRQDRLTAEDEEEEGWPETVEDMQV